MEQGSQPGNGEQIERLKTKGRELISSRKYAEAITVYDRVLELKPGDVKTLDCLGFLNYIVGRFEAALGHCKTSLAVKPDNFYAYKGMGFCLVRLGRPQEGIASIKRAIKLNPGYFDSYYDLGVTYMELRQFDQARHYFQAAAGVDARRLPDVNSALAYVDKLEKKQEK